MFTEDQTEVESRRVDEQSFENVLMASQMRSPHAAGFVNVGEAAFDQFAPLAHERLAPFPTDALAVPVDGGLLIALALPFSPTALGFGNVGSQVVFFLYFD